MHQNTLLSGFPIDNVLLTDGTILPSAGERKRDISLLRRLRARVRQFSRFYLIQYRSNAVAYMAGSIFA